MDSLIPGQKRCKRYSISLVKTNGYFAVDLSLNSYVCFADTPQKIYLRSLMRPLPLRILKQLSLLTFSIFLIGRCAAQTKSTDSIKLDYRKIYGHALQANIGPVFKLIQYDGTKKISPKDLQFIKNFKIRFAYATDQSNYLSERKSQIDPLMKIFRDYWRLSLKDTFNNYDTLFVKDAAKFLLGKGFLKKGQTATDDTIDVYMKKYVNALGYYNNGLGKTGRLYDLLVWRKQKDTVYQFSLQGEKINAPVVFMDDFITLGWEEYATLGENYPGGWTTTEAIYCVKSAYDLKSESFLVDLLAHEGRHFADKQLFPHLKSADLEYRAKLVQLSLLKSSVYETIDFFINESDHASYQNPHPFADYCVIRDLSKVFFKVDFEKDMSKWKNIPYGQINSAAEKLLQQNTEALKAKSGDVEQLIN